MKKLLLIDTWFLVVLFGGLTSIICLYVFQGIGYTNDSAYFIYSGCYDFLQEPTGHALSSFAPAYPVFLGFIHQVTSLSPAHSAMLINLLCYLLWTYGIYRSGKEYIPDTFYRSCFYTATLIGIPILQNVYMLWTETFFITIFWYSLYYLHEFIKYEKKQAAWIFSILLLLGFLTRYIMIGILPGLYLYLVLNFNKKHWKEYIVMISFTAVLPALWLLRNLIVNGSVAATYDPAVLNLSENIILHTSVLSQFILPDELPATLLSLSITILLSISLYFTLKTFKQRLSSTSHLFIIISFTLFLTILNTFKKIYEGDERYYSILYPSLMFIIFTQLPQLSACFSQAYKKICLVLVLLWMLYPVLRSVKNSIEFIEYGIGYQCNEWRNNDIILRLRTAEGEIVSNNPLPIILLNEKKAVTSSVAPSLISDSLYFVQWNKNIQLTYVANHLNEWTKYYTFDKVYSSQEGIIYQLYKK